MMVWIDGRPQPEPEMHEWRRINGHWYVWTGDFWDDDPNHHGWVY